MVPHRQRQHTAWTFGELPELMEVRRGSQVLVGFPALIDKGTHVEMEVFDEPDVAAAGTAPGLRRLVALQLKEPLKYLEKNIPDLQQMAGAYMSAGHDGGAARADHRPWRWTAPSWPSRCPPTRRPSRRRVDEGRTRLNLIAAEVARQAQVVLFEYAGALRKLKDSKPPKDVADDIAAQLQRLVPKRFLLHTPWAALQHLPRYLKGGGAAPGQAARRPGARRQRGWPSCARWSSATCAGWPI